MSAEYTPASGKKPTRSGMFAVRYTAVALHDPDDQGHQYEGFAYWDNRLRRWARASLAFAQAVKLDYTAGFSYHARQDLDWREVS